MKLSRMNTIYREFKYGTCDFKSNGVYDWPMYVRLFPRNPSVALQIFKTIIKKNNGRRVAILKIVFAENVAKTAIEAFFNYWGYNYKLFAKDCKDAKRKFRLPKPYPFDELTRVNRGIRRTWSI